MPGENGCVASGTSTARSRPGCLWLFAGAIGIVGLVASSLKIGSHFLEVANSYVIHRSLYYQGDVPAESDIARPLIDSEQTFDLAVTVWLRTDQSEDPLNDGEITQKSSSSPIHPAIPLYSDIVFRGLRLRDRNVFATVNFTVPTAYL